MAMSLELPARIVQEIAEKASESGISTEEYAALLVQLAEALVRGPGGPSTPLLISRRVWVASSDRDRLIPAIFGEMVRLWVHLRDTGSASGCPPTYPETSSDEVIESTIRLWLGDEFRVSIAADWSMVPYMSTPAENEARAAARARVNSTRVKLAPSSWTSEDFVREKHEEIELEERKWR